MLLLSNLSLQIPDSENKQRDQRCAWVRLRRRAAAAPPGGRLQDGGAGQQRPRGSYRSANNSSGIQESSELFPLLCRILFLGPRRFDPLSLYSPHSSLLLPLSLNRDWSLFQTIQPSSGSGSTATQGNAGSWTDFRRVKIASQLSDLGKGVLESEEPGLSAKLLESLLLFLRTWSPSRDLWFHKQEETSHHCRRTAGGATGSALLASVFIQPS